MNFWLNNHFLRLMESKSPNYIHQSEAFKSVNRQIPLFRSSLTIISISLFLKSKGKYLRWCKHTECRNWKNLVCYSLRILVDNLQKKKISAEKLRIPNIVLNRAFSTTIFTYTILSFHICLIKLLQREMKWIFVRKHENPI